jgi:hypothetical protein
MSSEEFKKDVLKQQIDTISLISENLLKAIAQAIISHKQSESNLAYCASHVQRAVNAVLALASDLGSINSIMQVEDSNNTITKPIHSVYDQVRRTAKKAEFAAQLAMEASMLNAEVSLNSVEASAQNLSENLSDLLTSYFSKPDILFSELSVKPDKFRKKSARGKMNSQAGKAQLSHLQPMLVLLQNELQVIVGVKAMSVENGAILYDQVRKDISVLQKKLIIAQSELLELSLKIKSLTQKMKAINRELNNSKDSLNRFFDMIRKMKAINPLISDNLISSCEKAQEDSVLAIELSSEALKSTIAARAEKNL